MTINVPIRPGAALDDPETHRFVEEHIVNGSFGRSERFLDFPELPYNKEAIVNILANYPWQEYGYKKGRWARVSFDEVWLPMLRTWEKVHHTLLLTHPGTGQEISEVSGLIIPGTSPSGRLRFAGDPHYAGVADVVTDGERRVCVMGSIRLIQEPQVDRMAGTAKGTRRSLATRARDLAKVMVPGRQPQAQLYEPPEKYLKLLGPWLADHPDKPRGKPS